MILVWVVTLLRACFATEGVLDDERVCLISLLSHYQLVTARDTNLTAAHVIWI